MYRWGSPRPADFAELWILFFFAVIGDCRLYRKNKYIKKNHSNPPPARNPWRCQPQGWIHVCSLQIIYNIGTKILYETCFATKMLFLFCKSMIPVRFCTIFPLHSCAGIKTRFKTLFKKWPLWIRRWCFYVFFQMLFNDVVLLLILKCVLNDSEMLFNDFDMFCLWFWKAV